MLVIDGYTQEGRDNLIEGGCTTAGELYRKMLDRQSPVGADSTIVYPSDRVSSLTSSLLQNTMALRGQAAL